MCLYVYMHACVTGKLSIIPGQLLSSQPVVPFALRGALLTHLCPVSIKAPPATLSAFPTPSPNHLVELLACLSLLKKKTYFHQTFLPHLHFCVHLRCIPKLATRGLHGIPLLRGRKVGERDVYTTLLVSVVLRMGFCGWLKLLQLFVLY